MFSLSRLAQTGLVGKWKKDEISKLDTSGGSKSDDSKLSITLEHTQVLFFLIVVGYAISTLVFGVEFLIGKSFKKTEETAP